MNFLKTCLIKSPTPLEFMSCVILPSKNLTKMLYSQAELYKLKQDLDEGVYLKALLALKSTFVKLVSMNDYINMVKDSFKSYEYTLLVDDEEYTEALKYERMLENGEL